MDSQQKRQRDLLLWIGGPLVGIFLLTRLGSGTEVAAILIVGIPLLIGFLVIRALVRVGDKRPEPVQIAQPPTTNPASVPPGWYPDQMDPTLVRWFDGNHWTPATLPRQQ